MELNANTILITGAAGFLARNFIYFNRKRLEKYNLVTIDSLTNGNIPSRFGVEGNFIHGDIRSQNLIEEIFSTYQPHTVINFAAETHVDTSIKNPKIFFQTNVIGTLNLLESSRKIYLNGQDIHFHHVSTDEVYGSLESQGSFTETTQYQPRSPYSASKASSDHLVMSFFHTYGLPVTISNSSNNYGPFQFSEKFIPTVIRNLLEEKPVPIYGDGENIRDWIHAHDHSNAIWSILQSNKYGEQYNISAANEISNIELAKMICHYISEYQNRPLSSLLSLLSFTKDRLGHDRRYSVNFSKIKNDLGWTPLVNFTDGLSNTIKWYITNTDWP